MLLVHTVLTHTTRARTRTGSLACGDAKLEHVTGLSLSMRAATLLAAVATVASVGASPLWDYVHTPDAHYSYFDTGFRLNQNGTGCAALCALMRLLPLLPLLSSAAAARAWSFMRQCA